MSNKLKLHCKLGILSRPDGSAIYTEGETSVIAGIYGPLEAKANKTLIDRAMVEAHFRPKVGLPGVKDKVNEMILKNICETAIGMAFFPRSAVIIVIQEMHNQGQLISCAVNAACLAALNSGIDMRCMFAAVTCFLTANKSLELLCPHDRNDVRATFVLVFDSIEKNVIASHTEGSFLPDEYDEALSLCKSECDRIFSFFKTSLSNK